MKQHNRKKIQKIILTALLCIIVCSMIFLVCLIHNATAYVEKKYNKDFKIISISYPTIKTIPISSIGLYYTDPVNLFRLPLILRIQKKIFLSYITRANFMMITSWKKLTDI